MSESNISLASIGTTAMSRWVVIGLSVLAASGIGFAIWFMGGPPTETAASPVFEIAASSDEGDDEPVITELGIQELATFERVLNRDPFEPVVPEPVVTETDDTTGSTTSPPAPTTLLPADEVVEPGDPLAPNPIISDEASPSRVLEPDAKEGPITGRSVSLLDITMTSDGAALAVVQVGSTIYEVSQGQRFAENFTLHSLQADCATINHGDVRFILCIDKSVQQ